ncbi:MAG: hypothetical protein WAL75_02330 [Terracidiphilus sp.]
MTDTTTQGMNGSPAMDDPDRLAGRLIQRAWNRDGLPEIAIGLFFLLLSADFAAQLLLEKKWPVIRTTPVATFLIFPLTFLMPYAVKWARNRYLIKRTGYVEVKAPTVTGRVRMAAIATIIAIVAVIAVVAAIQGLAPLSSRWILAGAGVFCGVLLPISGRELRFVFSGASIAVTGILLRIYDAGFGIGWMILYGVGGAITVVSGTVVLLRFLSHSREVGD